MGKNVSIIGAGLAGSEAALILAENGYRIRLYDAKPTALLPVYGLSTYAELVCNNSLSPVAKNSPLGLLVAELRKMNSKLIEIAEGCQVNDFRYFAIDKKKFSNIVTKRLKVLGVELINKSIAELPVDDIVILATGPLTNDELIENVSSRFGVCDYHFSDASSVIVDIRSIDLSNNNIKMINSDLYAVNIPDSIFVDFCTQLCRAQERVSIHMIDESGVFDKCLSIERLAIKGIGDLRDARFTHSYQPGNCLLLRRENGLENGFIMVGCMTTMRYSDQRDIFSCLPGFRNLRIIKYGRMHRNTFFNSPQLINHFYKVRGEDVYVIGQLSGVDGYSPAISSGLVAALNIINGSKMPPFPRETMIGGLAHYVSNQEIVDFQPMCASFSLLKPSNNDEYFSRSMDALNEYKKTIKCI